MALAPLLQVRVIVRRRDSSGVSIAWIAILLCGFLLWLCYGVAIGNLPLILTNVVSCTASAVTIAVVLRFRWARLMAAAQLPRSRRAVSPSGTGSG